MRDVVITDQLEIQVAVVEHSKLHVRSTHLRRGNGDRDWNSFCIDLTAYRNTFGASLHGNLKETAPNPASSWVGNLQSVCFRWGREDKIGRSLFGVAWCCDRTITRASDESREQHNAYEPRLCHESHYHVDDHSRSR